MNIKENIYIFYRFFENLPEMRSPFSTHYMYRNGQTINPFLSNNEIIMISIVLSKYTLMTAGKDIQRFKHTNLFTDWGPCPLGLTVHLMVHVRTPSMFWSKNKKKKCIHLQIPVSLFKSGVQGGILFMDMFSWE